MNSDDSHLNSLAVAHYCFGGICVLFACFPLVHMGLGLSLVFGFEGVLPDEAPPVAWFGWLFTFVGLLFFLMGQAFAIAIILAGRFLKERKNYLFSFIVGCLLCLIVPVGTVLGVLTIIVLSRDSVKVRYGLPTSMAHADAA